LQHPLAKEGSLLGAQFRGEPTPLGANRPAPAGLVLRHGRVMLQTMRRVLAHASYCTFCPHPAQPCRGGDSPWIHSVISVALRCVRRGAGPAAAYDTHMFSSWLPRPALDVLESDRLLLRGLTRKDYEA